VPTREGKQRGWRVRHTISLEPSGNPAAGIRILTDFVTRMLDPEPALNQGRICTRRQWCGSGFAWIRSDSGRLNPEPNPRGQKWPTKVEKSEENSCFEVRSLSMGKGFTCSLNVLHRGLGIKRLEKNRIFSSRKICYFSSSKPWIRISIKTSADCLEASGSGPVFRICKFLGDRDPLVVGMDPDPSGSSKNSKKRKPLISIVFWLLDGFISVKNDLNVPSKNSKQKNFDKK
jgi:hypothetical protein